MVPWLFTLSSITHLYFFLLSLFLQIKKNLPDILFPCHYTLTIIVLCQEWLKKAELSCGSELVTTKQKIAVGMFFFLLSNQCLQIQSKCCLKFLSRGFHSTMSMYNLSSSLSSVINPDFILFINSICPLMCMRKIHKHKRQEKSWETFWSGHKLIKGTS